VKLVRMSSVQARAMFPAHALSMPTRVVDEVSRFMVRVAPDPRDAVLARCQADPAYQRSVLACLQVRISIKADQTFPHPPDRRAQVANIIRAAILENCPYEQNRSS
jgi:hypothetical protein